MKTADIVPPLRGKLKTYPPPLGYTLPRHIHMCLLRLRHNATDNDPARRDPTGALQRTFHTLYCILPDPRFLSMYP